MVFFYVFFYAKIMSHIIKRSELLSLVQANLAAGTRVAAPVKRGEQCLEKLFYQLLKKDEIPILDAAKFPIDSIKQFFLPRSETLYTFAHDGSGVTICDANSAPTPTVIIGARPCDVAALPILDKVFAWDFADRFYQERREATTIITLACSSPDENCFCTSVGGSPEMTSGADAILFSLDEETFEVRVITEKGKTFFAGKTTESTQTASITTPPPIKFSLTEAQEKLRENYDHPVFGGETSLRCVACGACTYLCPTCHCFDMVDEGTLSAGRKVRNWDGCQFSQFTHHASGHNPRETQSSRQRQRIQHKMVIYPDKFGVVLCTGCGNCRRGCAAEVGVCEVMAKVASNINS